MGHSTETHTVGTDDGPIRDPSSTAWLLTIVTTIMASCATMLLALWIWGWLLIEGGDPPHHELLPLFVFLCLPPALGAAWLVGWGIATMFNSEVARKTIWLTFLSLAAFTTWVVWGLSRWDGFE